MSTERHLLCASALWVVPSFKVLSTWLQGHVGGLYGLWQDAAPHWAMPPPQPKGKPREVAAAPHSPGVVGDEGELHGSPMTSMLLPAPFDTQESEDPEDQGMC